MQFSNPDFSAAVRTLTGLGTAIATTFTVQSTIAASSTVNFQPAVGKMGMFGGTAFTGTSPTAAIAWRYNDGTHAQTIAVSAIATNAVVTVTVPFNNSVFVQIGNNDAAVAGTYMTSGYLFSN